MVEMGEERTRTQLHGEEEDFLENQEADERKLLSRYGIWLLVELAPPKEDIPIVSSRIQSQSTENIVKQQKQKQK